MTTPGRRLRFDAAGRLRGPAQITWNNPWPTPNGSWGSKGMRGVVMHTEVGFDHNVIDEFNNIKFQASAHFSINDAGAVHQYGPIGKGWCAWAQEAGNIDWYSIEHEDHGNPEVPLTDAQLWASAQVVEALSAFAGFPLQEANTVSERGYGVHYMGGTAWGGHTCVPFDATELLTPEGWRGLGGVRVGDLVAAWESDSGRIRFTPALRVVPLHLRDTIVCGGFEMTSDHGIYVQHRDRRGTYERISAAQAKAWHELPLAGHYAGPGLPVADDAIRLLVHVQADAHVMRAGHGQHAPKGLEFHYRKGRKIQRMLALLAGLGIDCKHAEHADGTHVVRIYDSAWTRQFVLRWLPDRDFSWEWLALSAHQFDVFHEELLLADGCRAVNKYATASQRSADVVMALHALHGYRANRDAQGMVVFGRTAAAGTKIPHVNALSSFGSSGREQVVVSCVTTEPGTIVIRQRLRRVGIIGNCPDTGPEHRVRSLQRPEILRRAALIRAGTANPSPAAGDGYLVTEGAAGGFAGRAVTSADGGKTWQ